MLITREQLTSDLRSWTTGKTQLAYCAVVLALLSFAFSNLTAIARAKLWLGPQTVVLCGVGACLSVAIAALTWTYARASSTNALDHPILWRRGMTAVVIACVAVSLTILYFAFATFPNSADEYGYLFQADTFSHGRMWNAPPSDATLFGQNLIVARNGIWISQYLPGWPAVLALFEITHPPVWLTTPVCGALLLVLLWIALRLECRSPALVVALLLAYGLAMRSPVRPLLIAMAVVTCITGLAYQFTSAHKEPWRDLLAQIGPQLARADDVVLAPMTDPTAFAYYAPYLTHLWMWNAGPQDNVENNNMTHRLDVQRMTREQLISDIRSGEDVWLILRTPDLPYVRSLLANVPSPRVRIERSCDDVPCIAALSWGRGSSSGDTGASDR
jgi:hypothetical protein